MESEEIIPFCQECVKTIRAACESREDGSLTLGCPPSLAKPRSEGGRDLPEPASGAKAGSGDIPFP